MEKKFQLFFKFLKKILEFFSTYPAVPRKICTTGTKMIKIHQLEQILENVPMPVQCVYVCVGGGVKVDVVPGTLFLLLYF